MTTLLQTPMTKNDAGAKNIGEYMQKLLLRLWEEEESFSGKRPFGNSDWQWEVYEAMCAHNIIPATFDSDGYLDSFDRKQADIAIVESLKSMSFE